MHNCVRCGRAAASLEEIHQGCPCGSKVFVFDKEVVEKGTGEKKDTSPPWAEMPAEKKQEEKPPESSGKVPDSYSARMTFTSEDVENIKIVREGVFLVDIKALSNNPVVLKDEEGVYYIKLPLEAGSSLLDGKLAEKLANQPNRDSNI